MSNIPIQLHFKFFWFRLLVQPNQSQECSYLASCTFWKSHGHFIMVSFSIKPGDQTDEIQTPNLNLVNKTELKGEYQSFSFFR